MEKFNEKDVQKALEKIGFPQGFPGSDCYTRGCNDMFECKVTGICPDLTDEQRGVLESVEYKPMNLYK